MFDRLARSARWVRLRAAGAPTALRLHGRGELLLLVVGLHVLAVAGWLLLDRGVPLIRLAVAEIGVLPVTFAVALLAWRTSRHWALDERTRRAWLRIGIAQLCLFAGDTIWLFYLATQGEGPVASWSDVAYLLYYPTLLWGLLSFPLAPRSTGERTKFLLDAATVVCGGAIVVWYFVLQTAVTAAAPLDLLSGVSTLGYPLGDLVLLVGVTTLWLRRSSAGPVVLILSCGVLLNSAADIVWAYQTHARTYQGGRLLDVLYMVSYWLVGLAAVCQYRVARRRPAEEAAAPSDTVSLLPYVAIVFGYGLLLVVTLREGTQPIVGLVIGAVVLTLLVLARQVAAVRDNMRLLAESSARASEARFQALVQHSSDVIAIVDVDSTVRFISPSVSKVFGYEPEALLGTKLTTMVHPDDAGQAHRFFAEAALHRRSTAMGSWRLRHADDFHLYVENIGTNLLDEPTVRGIVLNTRDVTERWALEEQLTHQAFHDSLTNLANRALFLDRVGHALARTPRRRDAVAVLFLDLDNFKTVNDSLGHAEGDRLLVAAAARLAGCVRSCDTIARLGGDEFAVLVEDARSVHDVLDVAERITAALTVPFALEGKEVFVTTSIGIATAAGSETTDELLRNADVAMYMAKTRGKGRFEVFEAHMHAAVLERLELEADLRRAIEREELSLHYQSIVRLADGEVAGVEALLRWQHPVRGNIPPSVLVPVAEETGLIVPIGRWVLREACRQARVWQDHRPGRAPLLVTVNISGRYLQDPALLDDVQAALDAAGLDPQCLVLEITESMLMENAEVTIQKLHELKALGLVLALDDFGTGYSSLSYLQRFPIDILKIDKSFVDSLGTGRTDPVVARAIIALGDTLELKTVAEGIERAEQGEALLALGCELGQGYHFGRPQPPEEIARRLGWVPASSFVESVVSSVPRDLAVGG